MGLIEDKGLTPLRLSEVGGNAVAVRNTKPLAAASANGNGGTKKPAFGFQSKRVPFAALEDFTRSLSSLLTAGVPLSRALTILYKETSNPPAAAKWRELHDAVIDGAPLAVAMAKSPDVFPRIYVAMVEAGEAGGFLDVVLAQIAEFQAREKELRAKVSAAMMYPAVLLTLATGVVIFLLVFFIPRFQTLFAGFNATLPPHHAHHRRRERPFLRHDGLFVLAGVAAAVWFGRTWVRNGQHAPFVRAFHAQHTRHWATDVADRHGAFLPDVRNSLECRRDAGQRPQRRAPFAWLSDAHRPRG